MMVGEGQSCEILGHPKKPQEFHSMKKYCLSVAISKHAPDVEHVHNKTVYLTNGTQKYKSIAHAVQ